MISITSTVMVHISFSHPRKTMFSHSYSNGDCVCCGGLLLRRSGLLCVSACVRETQSARLGERYRHVPPPPPQMTNMNRVPDATMLS